MKIRQLKIRNIASIEEADIDFETSLTDNATGAPAGTFLICGDTGTGKSVILDAISMALYRNTPRLAGVANKKQNEYRNSHGVSVSINCIEQYTRLGMRVGDECFSELVFEGNDGQEYHARLDLGLMLGNKDDNGVRHVKYRALKWRYKAGGGDWRDVEKKTGQPLLDAVGLSFEQFGRMAMLAQGQFASFLTGDKTERESILERLTDTAKFSTYGEAISNIFRNAEMSWKGAKTRLEDARKEAPTEEERNSLVTRRDELENEKMKLEEREGKLNATHQIVRDVGEAVEQKQKAEEERVQAAAVIEGDVYKSKKALVEYWDSTDRQRVWLKEKENAAREMEKARDALAGAEKTFDALSADIVFRENSLADKDNVLSSLKGWLSERAGLDGVYTEASAISLLLKHYAKTCRDLTVKDSALTAAKGKTAGLEQTANDREAAVEKAKGCVREKEAAIDELNKKRDALNPSETLAKMTAATRRKNDLEDIGRRWGELEELRKSNEKSAAEIEKANAELSKLEEACKSAESTYTEADQKRREANSLLSTMQMSLDDKLKALRHRIQQGGVDICPLCGQRIESIHLDDEFNEILTPLAEREKEAAKALAEADNRRKDAMSRYDTKKGALDIERNQHAESMKEAREEGESISRAAQNLSLVTSRPLPEEIEAALGEVDSILIVLKANHDEAEKLQKEIKHLSDEKAPLDKALSDSVLALQKAKSDLERNAEEIDRLGGEIDGLQTTKSSQEENLSARLGEGYKAWRTDPLGTEKLIRDDGAEYCDKKESAKELADEIAKTGKAIASMNKVRAGIAEKHPEWKCQVEPAEYAKMDVADAWTQLHSEINHEEKMLAEAEAALAEKTALLAAFFVEKDRSEESLIELAESENSIPDARDFTHDADSWLKSRKDAIGDAERRIGELLGLLAVGSVEEAPSLEVLEKALSEIAGRKGEVQFEIGAIQQKLEAAAEKGERIAGLEMELRKAEAVYEKWSRINAVFGGTRFRTLVQSYILRPLLNNANIYLEKITDRYALTCSEDNEQLSILVLDRYNKNQVRSATVLSGGERFMISLALSLALSSLNRPDMNVNILFIDEGFGTLDEANLNSVMSTLEKLQKIAGQSNRRVGIISHREELVERIPVKIKVTRKGEGRSAVEIDCGA